MMKFMISLTTKKEKYNLFAEINGTEKQSSIKFLYELISHGSIAAYVSFVVIVP
jgi:hypothetical protein